MCPSYQESQCPVVGQKEDPKIWLEANVLDGADRWE